jgi:hypothetical protein
MTSGPRVKKRGTIRSPYMANGPSKLYLPRLIRTMPETRATACPRFPASSRGVEAGMASAWEVAPSKHLSNSCAIRNIAIDRVNCASRPLPAMLCTDKGNWVTLRTWGLPAAENLLRQTGAGGDQRECGDGDPDDRCGGDGEDVLRVSGDRWQSVSRGGRRRVGDHCGDEGAA